MSPKTDNSVRYHEAKLELRRECLRRVHPSRVLDLYAGRGAMWAGAWRDSTEYLGVDRRTWRSDEPHCRLVIDNREACAVLNLDRFNVFDCDAHGEPWTVATLLQRRRWERGERGALCLTDGGNGKLRFGLTFPSLDALVPTHPDLGLRDVTEELHMQALAELLRRWRVEPLWWDCAGGFTGTQLMVYSAVVFRGLGDER